MPTQGSATVTLQNGNIGGRVADNDRVMCICMTGATEGTVVAGTPFLVSNPAAITALGLTEGNNPLAVKYFDKYVKEAEDKGIAQFQLYVLLVSNTMTINQMANVTNDQGAKKVLDFAKGNARIIAVLSDDTAVYDGDPAIDTTNGINADCYDAMNELQTLCNSYATANTPLRGIVGCTSFTGDATDLTELPEGAKNRVMMVIGDSESGNGCDLGTVMGRLAAIPVQRKISRVKDGPIQSTTAFIGATSADVYADTQTIVTRGFVTFKKFPNKAGFYFTGDYMATDDTDDYNTMSRGCVIDKAHALLYATYVEEIDEEVNVNDDGTIDANYAKYLEGLGTNAINLNMVALRNCASVRIFVDPTQNVVTTNEVAISAEITPVGYSHSIPIKLGFALTSE